MRLQISVLFREPPHLRTTSTPLSQLSARPKQRVNYNNISTYFSANPPASHSNPGVKRLQSLNQLQQHNQNTFRGDFRVHPDAANLRQKVRCF